MELSVYNIKGEDTGKKVTLNDAVFGIDVNEHAIYPVSYTHLRAHETG